MARLVTLTEIRDRVRRRADIENDLDRFPNTEINDEINASLARLHLKLVDVRGADYFEKTYRTVGTIVSAGTSPPAITVEGVPAEAYPLGVVIDIVVGGATFPVSFRFSTDGGTTWSSTCTPTAYTTVPLPGTGLFVTFPSGGYNANNTWTFTPGFPATVALAGSIALPYDFLELHYVEATIGGARVPLDRYKKDDRGWLRNVHDWYGIDRAPQYRVRGDARFAGQAVLDFAPIPQAAYPLEVMYCPQAEKFEILGIYAGSEGQSMHFDSGHEEWVIDDVAIKCREKDDLVRAELLARQAQIEAEIRSTGQQRDHHRPEHSRDGSEQWLGTGWGGRVLW